MPLLLEGRGALGGAAHRMHRLPSRRPPSRALCVRTRAHSTSTSSPRLGVPTFDLGTRLDAAELRSALEGTGFLKVTGHGIGLEEIIAVQDAARPFFDRDLEEKKDFVVGDMQLSRGYEISPEHVRFRDGCLRAGVQVDPDHPESGARDCILSERFSCGPASPPAGCDPDMAALHYAANAWPQDLPEMERALAAYYGRMEEVSSRLLGELAAALDLDESFFVRHLENHCSNLQVANYPSQAFDPGLLTAGLDGGGSDGGECLRKKSHADSGLLTILARAPSTEGAGMGGLQVLMPGGGGGGEEEEEGGGGRVGGWESVPQEGAELTVNVGNLLQRWTAGCWRSTRHRVANPPPDHPSRARGGRRLSLAYFVKPDPRALVEVVGSCAEREGAIVYPPARAGDLTRVGILAKFRHLPPEEASKRYHEEMGRVL